MDEIDVLNHLADNMKDSSTQQNESQTLDADNHPHDHETGTEASLERVKDLCARRDWLKQQIMEFKTNLSINSEDNNIASDTEEMETNLHRLKKEVQSETVNQMLKNLTLQRLQEAELMTKLLSADRSSETDGVLKERSSQCTKLRDLLSTQRVLCTDVLTQHKMIEEIQPQIDKLKKEVQELKIKIRLQMQELHTLQSEKENHTALSIRNADIASTQEKLSETKAMVAILTGVFKRLIMGSRIDWVQHEYLCNIMLDKDADE